MLSVRIEVSDPEGGTTAVIEVKDTDCESQGMHRLGDLIRFSVEGIKPYLHGTVDDFIEAVRSE